MKRKELTQHCCSTTLNYIPGVIDLLLDDHSVVLRALQRSVLMSLFIRCPSKKVICLRWDPLLCSTDTYEIKNAWIAIIKLGLISEIIKRDQSSFLLAFSGAFIAICFSQSKRKYCFSHVILPALDSSLFRSWPSGLSDQCAFWQPPSM